MDDRVARLVQQFELHVQAVAQNARPLLAVAQSRLRRLGTRDVLDLQHEMRGPSRGVSRQGAGEARPHDVCVTMQQAMFSLVAGAHACEQTVALHHLLLPVAGMAERVRRELQEVLQRVAQHVKEGAVGVPHA